MFKSIIGQDQIKKRLEFIVNAANVVKNGNAANIFQPLLITAPKGSGKTEMARILCQNLKDAQGNPRHFIEENGADLEKSQNFADLLVRMAEHEYCCVFIDEAHRLGKDIQNRLLTTFNVEKKCDRVYSHKGEAHFIDLRKHAFVLATTNPEKFLDPLYQRFKKTSIRKYKDSEIREIVEHMVENSEVEASAKTLDLIAIEARQSPRDCQNLVNELIEYHSVVQEKVELKAWREHTASMGFLPLGVTQGELDVLRAIAKHDGNGAQLSTIAGEVNQDSKTISGSHEPYLLGRHWIRKDTRRYITTTGKKVLDKIEKDLVKFS